MGVIGLIVKRARNGIGLLLTILLLAAGTTAIIAGTLGYSGAAATTAARAALEDADPTEAGIRVQTRLAADPQAQDAAAEQIIREAFAPTEVHVQRTIRSEPRSADGQSGRVIVMAGPALTPADPDFAERIEIVEGSWPQHSDSLVQGALHAGAAEQWGVGVGDQLDVSGTVVQITAVWRPVDPEEAFWFGDPLAAAGSDGSTVGPLVVPSEATTSFGSTPFVQFTVQPDPERILPADMPRLAAVAGTLGRTLQVPEVDVRGVTVEGDLAPTAEAAARNLATAKALNLVPVTLLLLVSLIAIVQIARLQAQARAAEVELLIARGASSGQVLRWSVIEAVAVAVVSAALGTLAALGVMRVVPAGDLQTELVVRTGLLAGLAVLLALVVVAVLQVRLLAARTAADRSGRTRTVAAFGTVVLTLGAAAFTWWQLNRYGSPLVTNADGSLRTDLVAGAAPAFLLAAAALLSTMVLGPVSRLVETISRRSRGLLTHLTAAQVSRRIVVYAVPVVLTVLAVGATTVAGLYAGTSAQLREDLAALGRGADIRAVAATDPVARTTLPAVPSLAGAEGVDASTAVWLSSGRLGNSVVSYTALPVDQLGAAVSVPEGVLDVPAVTEALRGAILPEGAIALPETATALDLTVELTAVPSDPEALQESVEQTYEWMHEQFGPDFTDEPPPPEAIEAMAREQVELIARDVAREREITPVLWFWDEASTSLLRVEAPTVPLQFDATLSDPPDAPTITVTPATHQGTVQIPVVASPGRALVGIDLGLPASVPYDLDLALTGLTTSGEGDSEANLLADPAASSWTTPIPSKPQQIEDGSTTLTSGQLQAGPDGLHLTAVTGMETVVPLEAPGLTGSADAPSDLGGGAGAATDAAGDEPGGDQAEPSADAVPVALTASLAATGNFEVGMPITVQAFSRNIPARVAAIVTAVPGSTAPHSALMDSSTLSSYLATIDETLDQPTQLWASSSDPDAALEAVRALTGIASATGPGSVSVTDAAGAVRLVFWVASAGAVLLAVTGIGAVAANLLSVRRPEVSVLRALGMTPGGQARTRVAELLWVVLASVGLGLLAGWLVGWLVVPELSSSTTLAGQVTISVPLVLEVPLWAGLLAALVVSLLLLLAVLYLTVHRQGLDREYREEIR
ncbi:ABC transporter permease [Ornithinimicrobium cryptoxanthini]|uniref:ABC transporter permease n=1 Tax=Ornithinimicrobium cryptoxanthini TaxID=2934161 RepID=A0ABY4YIC1_9MICO|nr:ABC transporter permease [Ornithinimicrobium cryptoxanthini]USQ76507.1 ABC transporter permease [Ornithinimicrobium cryptoxanthini]